MSDSSAGLRGLADGGETFTQDVRVGAEVEKIGARLHRRLIAAAGTAVMTGYAALAAVIELILGPMATVPDRTIDQIYADVGAAGVSMGVPFVLVFLGVGPLAAALVGIRAGLKRWSPARTAVTYLFMIAGGPLAQVFAGWAPGLALDETYAVDTQPLELTALLAVVSGLCALGATFILGGCAVRALDRKQAERIRRLETWR